MTESIEASPPALTDRLRSELAERWNAHPGIARIGARLEIVSANELRAIVDPIEPHHRGGMGTSAVNGPTIAAIFDLVTGLTGYLQAPGKRAAVAQLNIRFLRPVLGSRFQVAGRPQRTGHSLVFVGCELVDEANVVCAQCDGLVSLSQADGTGELAL